MPSLTQDLPVILHNDKRGLLTIEDGRLDVLQLSNDGRRESTRSSLARAAHR
jgi:sphingosine kinase